MDVEEFFVGGFFRRPPILREPCRGLLIYEEGIDRTRGDEAGAPRLRPRLVNHG